jgi:adenine-specific DNA-methyltransferase
MDKLDSYLMQSPDLNAERLGKLKELFPDLFAVEGKLNPGELIRIAAPESVREMERFEFKWFGKAQAKRIAFTPSKGALVYDESRSINPGKSDGNLIIEGENLEVLKLLLCSYREKIKCIYIDPPYNTGKDFVYSDNYTEDRKAYWEQNGIMEKGVKVDTNTETDGRFHSNWLDMMYSRLLIARQLLQEDGVIFVSIDDNEVHHLRMLMNEVFGEENFIAQIANVNNPKGRSDDKYIATAHEYILIYKKQDASFWGWDADEKVIKRYNKTDSDGRTYREIDLRKTGENDRREDRPNLFYYFLYNETTGDFFPTNNQDIPDGYLQIIPTREDNSEGNWRWELKTSQKKIKDLIPKYMPVRKKWSVFEKDYLTDELKVKAPSAWMMKDVNSERGSEQFVELGFSKNVFPKPKPLGLIKRIIALIMEEKDLILDFFAGSGSTAQAVMELNREDHGNRKFILVQLPEFTDEKSEAYKAGYKKISEITIERTKRTIEKFAQEQATNPTLFPGNRKEFGFKVYRLTKSAFPRVEFAPDPGKTEDENIAIFKQYIKEKEATLHTFFNEREIIDEVLLKNGFMLDYSIQDSEIFKGNKVYLVKDNYKEAFICLEPSLKSETVEYFKTNKDRVFICLERALDTTKKWNLKQYIGDKFTAF